ncbi:MAG TPA: TolC family protein [Oculatellaceae cyanobacterium]
MMSRRTIYDVTPLHVVVNDGTIRLAKANRLPDPVVNVGDSYSGNPPRPSTATRGFYIGVTQELPVLNRNQGEIARLKAIKAQLGIELTSTKNQATEEVVTAYQQLSAARERVELFQNQILPTSARVAKMARRAYEVGQSDINSTLAAQQANVQTKNAYLEAVRNYQQSLTDLEQAVGQPF